MAVPMLAGAIAVGATACEPTTTIQDGLVNVNIGDVTILEDVNVAVAAAVVAQICGVPVSVAVGIISAVDATSVSDTVCKLAGEFPVTVVQN